MIRLRATWIEQVCDSHGHEGLPLRRREVRVCLAIPGKIVQLFADEPHLALVEVGGVRRRVNIDLLREDGPLALSDWVLIHVGFAMSKISIEHAEEQMHLLAMLGGEEEAMREVKGYQL